MHLKALRLLSDLHDMFAAQLSLSALVVLELVGELSLMLQADQLRAHLLDGTQLPHLQLLHGLVLAEQHGMFQIFLRLALIKLLDQENHLSLYLFSLEIKT